MKQLPILLPTTYETALPFCAPQTLKSWVIPRILELVYTADDLQDIVSDYHSVKAPFQWNEERRFNIRCELDAVYFHLYISSEPKGDWLKSVKETTDQLSILKYHFPTPRDAVAYVMDQFPIIRDKDEKAYGHYRTKERILEIYDIMQEAQRTGRTYQTSLNPPPGEHSN